MAAGTAAGVGSSLGRSEALGKRGGTTNESDNGDALTYDV